MVVALRTARLRFRLARYDHGALDAQEQPQRDQHRGRNLRHDVAEVQGQCHAVFHAPEAFHEHRELEHGGNGQDEDDHGHAACRWCR